MNKVNKGWTTATRNPFRAVVDLVACLQSGYNAWIERSENADCAFPIRIKNPALNDKRNWQWSWASGGGPGEDFFNATIEDLTRNYSHSFKGGKPKLHKRKKGDTYPFWDHYKAKDGIPYWIPDPAVSRVFVIAHNRSQEPDKRYQRFLMWLWRPLRYIPAKSVLRMPEYTDYTIRIGGITHGYSVQFQIPKKFGWE